ncbi:MAG: hypothetical protein RMK29_05190 [Myxococcales bacterium]|nr:hypothetical protein [Myxococcota bacterium]MDW8281085.1 hypothetical protein [Myxococcales bacterium]
MNRLAPLSLVVLLGCGPPWLQHSIAPAGPPVMRSSNRPIRGLVSRTVLVLGPVSAERATAHVALRSPQPTGAMQALPGALLTTDYNQAITVAELALIERGWWPISQAVLARAAQQERMAGGLKELRSAGMSWLQLGLLLGRAVGAESLFVIRAIEARTDTRPVLQCPDDGNRAILAYTVSVDAALVRVETGLVDWAGVLEIGSGNFLTQPAIVDRTDGHPCRMRSADPAILDYFCVLDRSSNPEARCTRPARLSLFIERAVSSLVAKMTQLSKGGQGAEQRSP